MKNYRKANYDEIKKNLNETKWEEVLNQDNVNNMWCNFKNIIKGLEEKYVPSFKITNKNTKVPLDNDILELIREKNKLSKKFVKTKDPEIRKRYNRTRNKVIKLVRKARKNYEENLAREAKTNPKKVGNTLTQKVKGNKEL